MYKKEPETDSESSDSEVSKVLVTKKEEREGEPEAKRHRSEKYQIFKDADACSQQIT